MINKVLDSLNEQERAALVEKEKARTSLERYKMKIISEGWTIIPTVSFLYILYALYEYFRYQTYDIFFIIISLLLFAAGAIARSLNEDWENGLWTKYEAHGYPEDDENLPFPPKSIRKMIYKENYIHTDSSTEFY